jgi:hypothetical protein
MFSSLRTNLIYTNISEDIVEHDLDIDSDLWNYDGIDVYRGSFDPEYSNQNLQVYWLYDETSKRVGLAEHELDDPEIFTALWFKDTPFGTLFQEDGWKSKNTTLWSMMSNEAFQDCLEDEFKNVKDWALRGGKLLIMPSMLRTRMKLHTCEMCGKKSLTEMKNCSVVKETFLDFNNYSILFLDDSFVLYDPPKDSTWRQRLRDAYEPAQMEPSSEQADQQESGGDPLRNSPQPETPSPRESHQ